jgi:hypothetical protein
VGFKVQFVSMFFEPLFAGAVVGHDALHHIPEIFGMVHVCQMAQLMHDHIVKHLVGCEDEPVIEGQSTS